MQANFSPLFLHRTNINLFIMKHYRLIFFLFIISISSYQVLYAKVKLPVLFSNNMVLQQQSEVPFWGQALPNKIIKISTSWNGRTIETKADLNGNWKTNVVTPTYGGPFFIEITDGTKLKLENILIGEVWVCSGQSNMEMQLAGWGKINNYQQEIAAANYPNIRLLQVVKNTSTKPLTDLNVSMGGWVSCSPLTVADFSAVAYFFGKNLYDNMNVPIGLINTSWGGTVAEAWTSASPLKTMPDFNTSILEIEKSSDKPIDLKLKYEQDMLAWQHQTLRADKGYVNEKPIWADNNLNETDWKSMEIPCLWETKDLKGFDGVVWLRKTIDIPTDWQNKQLTLSLDMIDDNDITYFNGVEVGRTEGWNLTRTYSIPATLIRNGKNVITVRVFDTAGSGGIYGNPEKLNLSTSDNKKISLSGNWQYKIGFNLSEIPSTPKNWNNPNRPTVLYNAMIHPIVPFTIKGVIWYQGESNASRAYQYRELFPLMIKDWRKNWNINFPFYFVQLANHKELLNQPDESAWAELREAQLQTLHLENTGMAVTIDIGDAKDIHPKNKQEVGRRLSLIARANAYAQKIPFSGPIYESYKVEGNIIRIKFSNIEGGLKTRNGEPVKGFSISGLDHKFQWADAKIEGNEVIVWSKEISNPIAVRYAWAENPECNLYNNADLPTSPFRTDDWQGITAAKK